MKELRYNALTREALEQLEKGVFLTTKTKDQVNTMTIAWGNIGFMWKKPIFTVMVRKSRHTHQMLKETNEFTVSFPINSDMRKELSYCGAVSGLDVDKIKDCKLDLIAGQKVETPIIGNCSLHYECKIIGRQELLKDTLAKNIEESAYANGDFHTLYYGEIVACYLSEA